MRKTKLKYPITQDSYYQLKCKYFIIFITTKRARIPFLQSTTQLEIYGLTYLKQLKQILIFQWDIL